MKYDNEIKFDKERSQKKKRTAPLSISATVPQDQTLSFGDWKILEPGNFGTQPHFVEGSGSPALLQRLEPTVIENSFYRTLSTLSDDDSLPGMATQ